MTWNFERFVSVEYFEAACRNEHDEQTLLCEIRTAADRQQVFYTILDGLEVRARSIQHFILENSACMALSIRHPVRIIWNGDFKSALLLETLTKTKGDSIPIYTRLDLIVDGEIYTTEDCDTLSEAMKELSDVVSSRMSWQIKICHNCRFSALAFPGIVSDRDELRCYRDAPTEILTEVHQRGKFASRDVYNFGHYFVGAFHTCAAWQAKDISSS